MTLTGADAELVRKALERGDPFPGTTGFAGELDGTLVRDVLGRVPLFFEADRPREWSHDPADLDDPRRLPAGHRHDGDELDRWVELPDPDPIATVRKAAERVREAIEGATADVDQSGLAVAFSGGIDSAILAARFDAPLYTVGFPDSHDVAAARSAAALLDRDLTVVTLDRDRLEAAIDPVVRATGRTNAMDVGIALPLFELAGRIRADGYDRLALGQGADELFGGYAKVARAPEDPRVAADTVRGARRELVGTLPRQLERDVPTLRAAGVDPVVPLLSDRVVETALSLPGEALVTDRGERKWALRLAARTWLPDHIAFREKKAVQYGSSVARELDRLARQSGFKRREDDHVSEFIRARTSSPREAGR